MLDYHLYLNNKHNTYTTQSLVNYGILVQNDRINIVKPSTGTYVKPYYIIDEAIICHPDLNNKIRKLPNVEVYKNGKLVLKKSTDDTVITRFDTNVFDLYDANDRKMIMDIIESYENTRKVYAINTEPLPVINTNTLVGLSSGSHLAQLAYENNLVKVIYYDYSNDSLTFQQELLHSNNRYETYVKYLGLLTTGFKDATIDDINTIDFDKLNTYYDYLKTIEVSYKLIDMRSVDDIKLLLEATPNDATLWVSNVYHYITSLNDYNHDRYLLIDRLCAEKNITLLPYTRIYYES